MCKYWLKILVFKNLCICLYIQLIVFSCLLVSLYVLRMNTLFKVFSPFFKKKIDTHGQSKYFYIRL